MARPPFVPTQMASVVKKGAAEVHLNVVGNESFSSLFNSIKSGVQTGVKSAVKAGRQSFFVCAISYFSYDSDSPIHHFDISNSDWHFERIFLLKIFSTFVQCSGHVPI